MVTNEELREAIETVYQEGNLTKEEYSKLKDELEQEIDKRKVYQERVQEFKKLSWYQLAHFSMDELVKYKKGERAYNLEHKELPSLDVHEKMHFLVQALLDVYHKFSHINVKTIGEVPKTKRPIIFAISHVGAFDVDAVCSAIKRQAYLLSADEEGMYRTIEDLFFQLQGVNYLDPRDKADTDVALKTVKKYLRAGRNIYWNPEGTWNLTENYVMLPIHYGIIEAAYEAGVIIIPIGVKMIDKEKGLDFVVNIGEIFDVREMIRGELTRDLKISLAEELRSIIAGLKYDMWDSAKRDEIPDDYFRSFLERRIAEWPFYDVDIIRSRMFNPHHDVYERDVFKHLEEIEIGKHNAFLARSRRDFLEKQEKVVFKY